jgi:hypothetical protein
MTRRRRHGVSTAGKPFDDSTDSHVELIPQGGRADLTQALTPQVAPPSFTSNLGRLLRLAEDSSARVWERAASQDSPRGARVVPLSRLSLRSRVNRWAEGSVWGLPRFTPLQASPVFLKPSPKRSTLNRLSLDPRQRVCLQRSQRREVLFARRIAGRHLRSPGRGGSYRRGLMSQWSC